MVGRNCNWLTLAICGSGKPQISSRVHPGPRWWPFAVAVCPGPVRRAVPHGAKVAPPHGQSRHGMQLQARSHARSAIYSQDTRRSERDTCNGARTSCTQREPAPRHWREQHQHAHCAQQTWPMAALSYCSPCLHADLAQNVRQKRAPSCCGRPSAVASPHCRSSRGWTP